MVLLWRSSEIGVGLVMVLEAYSLWRPGHGSVSSGQSHLEYYFTGAEITSNFPFPAFFWLPLLPPTWIYVMVGLIAVTGCMVALGFCYRVAVVTLFFSWGYLFAAESMRTYWQSYYYLELIVIFLLIWMPAQRVFSVDAWRARRQGGDNPVTVPFWPLFLLRGQLLIAYFYGGAAKLNQDWLLDAMPVRWYLREPGVLEPYEAYLTSHQLQLLKGVLQGEAFAFFLSYTGLVFDLAVGFLLLFRRSRIFALLLMLIFHTTNHFLIFDDIEWFPVVGAWTALIFLDPDWPRRFRAWLKRPFLKPPDWNWFWPGIILFPPAGGALGWKLKASPPMPQPGIKHPVRAGIAVFVVVWLGLQTLIPLRHFLIPGDGRFTYEGMNFSWRLKSEFRQSFFHEIQVVDDVILGTDATGRPRILWPEWHGEQTVYRKVHPGKIDWRELPEIVVLLEPILGERVLFNPVPKGIETHEQAQERLNAIWNELYGSLPSSVLPALAFPDALHLLAQSFAAEAPEAAEGIEDLAKRADRLEQGQLDPPEARATHREIGVLLNRLQDSNAGIPALRRTLPFALQGEKLGDAPFLIIQDSTVPAGSGSTRVDRGHWHSGPSTRAAGEPTAGAAGGDPLMIYMGQVGSAARHLLPLAYFLEDRGRWVIRWNSAKDLSASQHMHSSAQPFYLRRHARRIASWWEKEYGRRPSVHALTAVSLNGRPYQELVDPQADLARVDVKWFRHNEWIRYLRTERIPPDVLAPAPSQK